MLVFANWISSLRLQFPLIKSSSEVVFTAIVAANEDLGKINKANKNAIKKSSFFINLISQSKNPTTIIPNPNITIIGRNSAIPALGNCSDSKTGGEMNLVGVVV